ncbi:hypothetical protein OG206_07965 [Streptomyces sp. NBC_01341]|uniref:hypothetical protein n=1 Tax=Streptomyces sp. NBC_01341 TaxID=2903831 RepID=UPI002E13864C|nr:hypothetical protein OG206_07965 [Streptomyces sp. NBC_01341]
MVQKPQNDAERKERRIDLSLPQVAGSAVAAVAAAVMASQLGVYGTIAGAGVMSVVATCGGSVFQHFFRRTGEQIREVTVQVKHPAGRQVTVRTKETSPASQWPRDEATTVMPPVTESDAERTRLLRRVRPGDGRPVTEAAHLGTFQGEATADDAYSAARTHGTRVRGWKRSALAAAGVFVISMAGITVYEAASGHDLGGNGGTTVGSVVRGEPDGRTESPEPSSGTGQDDGDDVRRPDTGATTTPGTDPRDGQSASPDASGGGGATEEPAPTPSASSDPTTPESTPSAPGDGGTPSAPATTGAGDAAGVQDDAASGADTGR